MRTPLAVTAAVLTAMSLLAGCSTGGPGSGEKRPPGAAVVIVSGGDAVSPFTTPDQACATGLAAGNTDTAIREQQKVLELSPGFPGAYVGLALALYASGRRDEAISELRGAHIASEGDMAATWNDLLRQVEQQLG